MESQPETSSEFGLFARASSLAEEVCEFILSTRGQVTSAEDVRDNAHKVAAATLAKAQDKCETVKRQIDAERLQSTRECDKALNECAALSDKVRQFLVSNGSEISESPRSLSSQAATPRDSGQGQSVTGVSELIEVNLTLKELRADVEAKIQNALPRFWPRKEYNQAAVALLTLVALAVYWPGALIYPLANPMWRSKRRREALSGFNEPHQQCARVKQTVEDLKQRQHARSIERTELSVNRVLIAAKAAHQESESEIARSFQAWLDGARDSARRRSQELQEAVRRLWNDSGYSAADLAAPEWGQWKLDSSPEFAARFGVLEYSAGDLQACLAGVDFEFSIPALAPFAEGKCLSFSAAGPDKEFAVEALRAAVVHALASTPAGRARFTFIDPVGQGHNVSDFMRLGDFDKDLVSGKAWSEPRHIEEQLARLAEHTETVIQKYLRRDFDSILAYNRHANEVAEPYHFLVIFDFPTGFSDAAARRLVSLVRNGPRCGVFVLLVRDTSKAAPHGFVLGDLEECSSTVICTAGKVEWPSRFEAKLTLDSTVGHQELIDRIILTAGESAQGAMRVEVPFARVLALGGISEETWWKGSTESKLSLPIGPTGAKKAQFLTLGEGLTHHGLIVGRTGSGKTNLMHVIITGAALAYSPEELQLFLIDFKGGVGFKPYAQHGLPHARVIAIESEREFGFSVLQGLDQEMNRRFEAFRAAGVDNLTAFRAPRSGDGRQLPRVLLIIDEFQELFAENDSISDRSRQILERIVRQGRSFGLHVLLGSQSLAGSGQLPQAILGQLGVRIALPCNDADAKTVFAHDNGAARLLSRPGEAIYNGGAGEVASNNPFQVAMIGDSLGEHLVNVSSLAERHQMSANPIVFDGNEPARLTDNAELRTLIEAQHWPTIGRPRAWLGEPIAIQPPLGVTFDRQAGRHLLIVSRDESEGAGLLFSCLISLLAGHPPTTAKFYILDMSTSESPWSEHARSIQSLFTHQIELLNRHSLEKRFADLCQVTKERLSSQTPAARVQPHYVFVIGLHRARDLRKDDSGGFSQPSGIVSAFASLLREGPEAGVHFVAWCDTVTNAKRSADRSFQEFGLRVGGPMSIDDSRQFFDAGDASKLSKPCRLVFADDEKPGMITKFRPYALPSEDWLHIVSAAQKGRSN